MKNTHIKQIIVLCGIIFIAAMSRLVPHYPNVTPIGATALFGAAYFSRKYLAILVPLLAVLLSDLVLYSTIYTGYEYIFGNHIWVYLGILSIVLFGTVILKKITFKTVFAGSLVASGIFFLLTNFGAWLTMPYYPPTGSGLLLAFEAGIPFFWNTLAGDLFYCGVLFGGYALITYLAPSLKLAKERA